MFDHSKLRAIARENKTLWAKFVYVENKLFFMFTSSTTAIASSYGGQSYFTLYLYKFFFDHFCPTILFGDFAYIITYYTNICTAAIHDYADADIE